jgi:hypothetical protein
MPKLAIILLLVTLSAACSTKQVLIPAKGNLKLVNESIAVNVNGPSDETDLLNHLGRELKARLILAGFDIEKQTGEKLALDVNVTEFNPGDAAARMIVGFGAGRGSLIYTAEYKTAKGEVEDGRARALYRWRGGLQLRLWSFYYARWRGNSAGSSR